jgi:curved DNA-binding protein CbpA
VTDYFAILGLPRRVWLPEEEIKDAFLRISAQVHPDRVHNSTGEEKQKAQTDFAELNTAQNRLRIPRERILHLLELSGYGKPAQVQNVPAAALELFAPVAELTRGADAFLAEKTKASSPMLKAQFFEKGLEWTDKIQKIMELIAGRIVEIEQQFKLIDAELAPEKQPVQNLPEGTANRLHELAATLGFLERWRAQLQERVQGLM